MKTVSIKVDNNVLDFCNNLLQSKDRCLETEENPFTFTANFGQGIEADIKVVNADPPYIDPVLFLDGNEVGLMPADADTLNGEYVFTLGAKKYRVIIENN